MQRYPCRCVLNLPRLLVVHTFIAVICLSVVWDESASREYGMTVSRYTTYAEFSQTRSGQPGPRHKRYVPLENRPQLFSFRQPVVSI